MPNPNAPDSQPPIQHYDPNQRFGKHIIEAIVQEWDYRCICTIEIGGNCRGLSILTSAGDDVVQQILDGKAVPTNPVGDTLDMTDMEDRDIEQSIVSLRIVGFIPESEDE